ncbi:hypothetical protein BC830DRAFT_1143393 [Chytriomyces sp. MP71]|nr:hypothetical protein BC830DRAFT_1143393 [Chytriomyces sp. MP71]
MGKSSRDFSAMVGQMWRNETSDIRQKSHRNKSKQARSLGRDQEGAFEVIVATQTVIVTDRS